MLLLLLLAFRNSTRLLCHCAWTSDDGELPLVTMVVRCHCAVIVARSPVETKSENKNLIIRLNVSIDTSEVVVVMMLPLLPLIPFSMHSSSAMMPSTHNGNKKFLLLHLRKGSPLFFNSFFFFLFLPFRVDGKLARQLMRPAVCYINSHCLRQWIGWPHGLIACCAAKGRLRIANWMAFVNKVICNEILSLWLAKSTPSVR